MVSTSPCGSGSRPGTSGPCATTWKVRKHIIYVIEGVKFSGQDFSRLHRGKGLKRMWAETHNFFCISYPASLLRNFSLCLLHNGDNTCEHDVASLPVKKSNGLLASNEINLKPSCKSKTTMKYLPSTRFSTDRFIVRIFYLDLVSKQLHIPSPFQVAFRHLNCRRI